jgi:hypothetical protein
VQLQSCALVIGIDSSITYHQLKKKTKNHHKQNKRDDRLLAFDVFATPHPLHRTHCKTTAARRGGALSDVDGDGFADWLALSPPDCAT